MEYINGEYIMTACEEGDPGQLRCIEDLYALIDQIGFLPLFANKVKGFSVEEHVSAGQWWTGDELTDPWEWRQIAAGQPDIAYGKFFDKKAGFISKNFFPAFVNYRRDGYDFDALFEDEKASYQARKVMDVFDLDDRAVGAELMSPEVKVRYGAKGFERIITDLQMQTYLIVSGFKQRRNRKGELYGWHIAVLSTPETKWGYEYVTSLYSESPAESFDRILNQMKKHFPDVADFECIKVVGHHETPYDLENQTERSRSVASAFQAIPWPDNLINDLAAKDTNGEQLKCPISDDQMKGLRHAMSFLKAKEQKVLRMRYEEHMTLNAIAGEMKISGSRVGQIRNLALRKMRNPKRSAYYIYGYEYAYDKEHKSSELQNAKSDEERYRILNEILIKDAGFDTRITNTLQRNCIPICTVADLAHLVSKDEEWVHHLRNVGSKTAVEILNKLEEFGVDCTYARSRL